MGSRIRGWPVLLHVQLLAPVLRPADAGSGARHVAHTSGCHAVHVAALGAPAVVATAGRLSAEGQPYPCSSHSSSSSILASRIVRCMCFDFAVRVLCHPY